MFVKNLSDCEKFSANDGCDIQELLHPANDLVDIPYSIAIASVQTASVAINIDLNSPRYISFYPAQALCT